MVVVRGGDRIEREVTVKEQIQHPHGDHSYVSSKEDSVK